MERDKVVIGGSPSRKTVPPHLFSFTNSVKMDMRLKFLFFEMKVQEKIRRKIVDGFFISYLVPEISRIKGVET